MIRILKLMTLVLLLLLSSGRSTHAQESSSSLIVEVVNVAGQPIKYACVTFVPRSGDIVFRKADSRGRVRVKRLVRGKYRVVVKVDGYEVQKKEIELSEAKDTLAFVMKARN